jgi:hypothetical protein
MCCPRWGCICQAVLSGSFGAVADGEVRWRRSFCSVERVRSLPWEARAHWVDALGDDPRSVAVRRWRRSARRAHRKQQTHAVGTAQVEVVPDQLFEEAPTLYRRVEDLGQAHLELPYRQAVLESCMAVVGGERPRKPPRPTIEKALHFTRPEPVTELLRSATESAAIFDACRVLSLTTEPSSQAGRAILPPNRRDAQSDGEEVGLGLGLDLSQTQLIRTTVARY